MFKGVFPLVLISSLRFFGLFIVLPVIGLYTDVFHTSAFLAGLAAGAYAITQIIFQTPFGIWSDKYGRKHIVGIGLIIFLLGSLVCAFSQDITMLIIGRFLQGVGAVGGVISAQIADLVKEENRDKAMAIMGGGIFASFILAMLLSPIITSHFGLNILFFITSAFCVLSIIILYWKVPDTPSVRYNFQSQNSSSILKNKNLIIMNLSAFLQKFLMTFAFVCISLALKKSFEMHEGDFWYIYFPAAIVGILAMGPSSVFAQKRGRYKAVMLTGIIAFALSYALMAFAIFQHTLILFSIGVFIFFIGFAIHEPIAQSLASRYPKAHQKGAALGLFTTFGYVGSALGGMCGGWLYESIGLFPLSILIALVCILWGGILMLFLTNPKNHKNIYLPLDRNLHEKLACSDSIPGVIEWYINQSEQIIIIKYDTTLNSQEQILNSIKASK